MSKVRTLNSSASRATTGSNGVQSPSPEGTRTTAGPSPCCWQYQSMPSTGCMNDWACMDLPPDGRRAGRSHESINLINDTLTMCARNAAPEQARHPTVNNHRESRVMRTIWSQRARASCDVWQEVLAEYLTSNTLLIRVLSRQWRGNYDRSRVRPVRPDRATTTVRGLHRPPRS